MIMELACLHRHARTSPYDDHLVIDSVTSYSSTGSLSVSHYTGLGGLVAGSSGYGSQPVNTAQSQSQWIRPRASGHGPEPVDTAQSQWIRPSAIGYTREPVNTAQNQWVRPSTSAYSSERVDKAQSP